MARHHQNHKIAKPIDDGLSEQRLKLGNLQNEIAEAISIKRNIEEGIKLKEKDLAALEASKTLLVSQVEESKNALEKVRGEHEEAKVRRDELDVLIKESEFQLEEVKKNIQENKSINSELLAARTKLQGEIVSCESSVAALKREKVLVNNQIADSKEVIESLNEEIVLSGESVKKVSDEINSLNETLATLKEKRKEIESALTELGESKAAFLKDWDAEKALINKEKEELRGEIKRLRELADEANLVIKDKESSIEYLDRQISVKSAKLSVLNLKLNG